LFLGQSTRRLFIEEVAKSLGRRPHAMTCQFDPGLNEPATLTDRTLVPSISQIAGVPSWPLPQDVGLTVTVENAELG
jgi:hypothetical protein